MLNEVKHLALVKCFSLSCEIEILRCAQNDKLLYVLANTRVIIIIC
jgi:hypothetical protein